MKEWAAGQMERKENAKRYVDGNECATRAVGQRYILPLLGDPRGREGWLEVGSRPPPFSVRHY